MEVTLNNYLKRNSEILTGIQANDNIITQKERNEIQLMITILEQTLSIIKSSYEPYHINNKPNITTLISPIRKSLPPTLIQPSGIVALSSKSKLSRQKTKQSTSQNLLTNVIQNYQLDQLYRENHKININWVPSINQYYIKINNLILRGNLANIYDKKILLNDKIHAYQVKICSKKNDCLNILTNVYCKYYHDPLELLELKNKGKITNEFYLQTIQYTRNFSNTAWIYSNSLKPYIKNNMRCIGSKSSLNNDISMMKIVPNYECIDDMKQQVMHDILILLKLSEAGLC
jgi:hypothetical protein